MRKVNIAEEIRAGLAGRYGEGRAREMIDQGVALYYSAPCVFPGFPGGKCYYKNKQRNDAKRRRRATRKAGH